ncbi:MAG: MFS transporter [Candidatus Thorarchaeota archaeon]
MSEYSTNEKVLVFIACALGWAFDAVGLTLINFVATDLMVEFGQSFDAIGFVFSAQYVATVPGAILFGNLADRYGRKNLLLFSILWDAILTAGTAFAPNFAVLAILRILSGMGVSWGIAYALLGEVFSPTRRGLFGGLMHAMFLLGYIISNVAAIIIVPLYGWRPTFFVTLLVIPVILVLYYLLPESKLWQRVTKEEEEMDVPLRTGIAQVFREGYGKLLVFSVVLFWAAEFAYHAIVDWGPTFLELELSYSQQDAKFIILLISLLAMLILPAFGLLSDKIGRRKSFVLSAFVGLISTIMLGIFAIAMPNNTLAVISLFIIPAGFGSHALFGVWASEMFPTKSRAAATSVIFSLARGLSFGGWFVGILAVAVGLSWGMMLAIIGFILMVFLPFTLPETAGKDFEKAEASLTTIDSEAFDSAFDTSDEGATQ